MRTVAILQARMGSNRLPGKVLADLGGKPVITHCVERASRIRGVDAVCVATSTAAADDAIAEAMATHPSATLFRGSERDVLDRYRGAAHATEADVVVRLTCDCPLLDPAVCAAVVELRIETDAPYATNVAVRDWPHGLDCEVFPASELSFAARTATAAYDREHVTPFIRRRAGDRIADLPGPGGAAARQRWTLDYPEDLAFLRALFALLPRDGLPGWSEVMAVVEANPRLSEINENRVVEGTTG